MRSALAIALGLASAAALAQVTQPGSPPSAGASAGTSTSVTPLAAPDAGSAQTSLQQPTDAGPTTRAARTGDEASTQPAQRIYSFDPLPIGNYSFEAPAAPTSQSSPSSSPR